MMRETAYDYDQSIFYVQRDEDSDLIKFGFSCNGSKEIMQNGGEEMINTLYRGNNSLYEYILIRKFCEIIIWEKLYVKLIHFI